MIFLARPEGYVGTLAVGGMGGAVLLVIASSETPPKIPIQEADIVEKEIVVNEPCSCNKYKFEYTNDFDRLACMFPGQKNTCAMKTQSASC